MIVFKAWERIPDVIYGSREWMAHSGGMIAGFVRRGSMHELVICAAYRIVKHTDVLHNWMLSDSGGVNAGDQGLARLMCSPPILSIAPCDKISASYDQKNFGGFAVQGEKNGLLDRPTGVEAQQQQRCAQTWSSCTSRIASPRRRRSTPVRLLSFLIVPGPLC